MSKRFRQKWGIHSDTCSMGEIRQLYEETLLDGNFSDMVAFTQALAGLRIKVGLTLSILFEEKLSTM